jgi:uncharacterized membrane protein
MAAKTRFKDADMQAIIGWVLRTGVILSVSVVIIGGIVYIYRHGGEAPDHRHFVTQPSFVQLNGIIQGIFDFHGRSIIQAGIILLIATPILRIIFSALGFVLEKDRLYVFISLLVLLIIFLSSMSGHIG